jgi:hypothetical protein
MSRAVKKWAGRWMGKAALTQNENVMCVRFQP